MLTIIKVGNKKTKEQKQKEKCYKAKCWNCGTKFLYQDEDTKTVLDCPPEIWWEVPCPNCDYIQDIHWKIRSFKYKITEVKDEHSREI